MSELLSHDDADAKARRFFEDLWTKDDHWEFESSEYERAKYLRQLELLGTSSLGRVLELGCGSGHFTRMLATRASHVVGVDISATAIKKARVASASVANIEFVEENIMRLDLTPMEPWDLVVMSETMYYIGWLYSFFDAGMLAQRLHGATAPGGKLLMCNTLGYAEDWLMLPPLIRSYRDLFANTGFALEQETLFRGRKNGVDFEALITLQRRAPT